MNRKILAAVSLFLMVGCSSIPKSNQPPVDDLISVSAAVELARGAFTAGCVRSHNQRSEKGHFADCRAAADTYVDEEVVGIIRGKAANSQ